MKKFDNFDESVKNKMDGMNFSFNEANWEKMSQVLDATRPAKKPFGKLPLISAIIMGGALIIGSTWYVIADSLNAKEVAQNSAVVNVPDNADLKTNNAAFGSNTQNNSDSKAIITNEKAVLTSDSENANASVTTSAKEEVIVSKVVAKNAIVTSNSEKKKVRTHKTNNSTPVNSFASNSQDQKAINADDNVSENTDVKNQVPVGAIEGDHLKNGALNGSVAQQTNDQTSEQDKNIIIEENDLISMPNVTTNLGQTAETIAAANLVTSVLEEKKAWEYVRVKHHTMTVEGGAINSFGWKVNQTRNGNNISPVLGINYMYNIDSRSSLLIGLQYNTLANLGEAKADFSVTSYGFGVNNDVTTYKLSDLHYAVMPIKYIHRIDKNNAVGFGANAMYLVNARTQITDTQFTESNVSTNVSHYEFGYGFNQLNRFNAQLAVSYHHSISNKLAINVELNKSVMNVVKDYKYYGAKSNSSAPGAVKLSLTYTLFNR
jgi:hypothetical protein